MLKVKALLYPLLLSLLVWSCSSTNDTNKEKDETDYVSSAIDDTPQEVICQGDPENCDYEIQQVCQPPNTYEIIGKPIPSFFSTSVTYKVRYKCIEAK